VPRAPARRVVVPAAVAHHPEGDPRQPTRHPHVHLARVLPRGAPSRRQGPEVVVAPDQGVGRLEQRLAEPAIAAAGQPARGEVDPVALIPPGEQPRPPGDHPRRRVVRHRPGLAGEFAGRDHVEPRQGQQPDVGRLDQVGHQLPLARVYLLKLVDAIVVQGDQPGPVQLGVGVGVRGIAGPAQDAEQGRPLHAGAPQPGQPGQPLDPRRGHGRRGRVMAGHVQSKCIVEHRIETACVSGQVGLDLLEDLAAEQGLLVDQVAAMAGPELQRRVGRVAGGLLQAEAVDRGAEDPRLGVGPIGLGIVLRGLAVMAGDRGVDDAGVEAGDGEGALHRAMIAAGLLDGDDQVAEVVLGDGAAEVVDGGVESRAGVLDGGEGDEDAAVEVGEQPGGAGLGAVDGDDTEVLRADGLDARGEQAVGLAEVLATVGTAAAAGSRAGLHGWVLRERPRVY
jgi:hypothetical protein